MYGRQLQVVFLKLKNESMKYNDILRYDWKHGVFSRHIRGRRIALTMREPALDFQEGGALYEKFGKELIRLGNIRVPLSFR